MELPTSSWWLGWRKQEEDLLKVKLILLCYGSITVSPIIILIIFLCFRYPVYTRHHDYYGQGPAWLPPGSVQMYGHHPHPTHHHYYDPEFRSNSANLPLPPPVEYVWASRPTRRTKSSAHPRQHRHYIHPRHPPSPQFYPPEPPPLVHHSSFARYRDENGLIRISKHLMCSHRVKLKHSKYYFI